MHAEAATCSEGQGGVKRPAHVHGSSALCRLVGKTAKTARNIGFAKHRGHHRLEARCDLPLCAGMIKAGAVLPRRSKRCRPSARLPPAHLPDAGRLRRSRRQQLGLSRPGRPGRSIVKQQQSGQLSSSGSSASISSLDSRSNDTEASSGHSGPLTPHSRPGRSPGSGRTARPARWPAARVKQLPEKLKRTRADNESASDESEQAGGLVKRGHGNGCAAEKVLAQAEGRLRSTLAAPSGSAHPR